MVRQRLQYEENQRGKWRLFHKKFNQNIETGPSCLDKAQFIVTLNGTQIIKFGKFEQIPNFGTVILRKFVKGIAT